MDLPVGGGIRVDTYLMPGATVPPYYDSLVAKVIATGADRAQALERMGSALARCSVDGVGINAAWHARVIAAPEFVAGGVSTTWI